MAKIAEVQEVAVRKLVPYENNAKLHDIDAIVESIKEFGFLSPCLIDRDFNVIAGHGRIEAAKKLKMKTVPCVFVEGLTDEQRRAYILVDNKLTELGGWDMDMLNVELGQIDDIDMGQFGFELDDIEEIQETVEDDFVEEDAEENLHDVQRGDIWQLGRHRLICGDATDFNDVQKLMDGKNADLLITDPPYNVDYVGKTKDALKISNDNMSDEDFREFLRDAFTNADAVMKPGAVFYIWHADSEGYNFRGSCHDIGWQVRECLVWNKNSMVMGRQDYQWKHEPCLYGWKEGAGHLWNSDRSQTTVLDFDRPTRSESHPTMKPIALFDYLIQNSSKSKSLVLDLFAGSGTTIIACEQNKRTAYCSEIDPHYCDVIIQRWEKFTGEKAVRL